MAEERNEKLYEVVQISLKNIVQQNCLSRSLTRFLCN